MNVQGKLVKRHNGSYRLVIDKQTRAQVTKDGYNGVLYGAIGKLSLANCMSIERGFDLEDLAEKWSSGDARSEDDFMAGAEAILELVKDKMFTRNDMEECWSEALNSHYTHNTVGVFMESLQEWDVEVLTEPMDIDETQARKWIS
jgi:hypothetical protein